MHKDTKSTQIDITLYNFESTLVCTDLKVGAAQATANLAEEWDQTTLELGGLGHFQHFLKLAQEHSLLRTTRNRPVFE